MDEEKNKKLDLSTDENSDNSIGADAKDQSALLLPYVRRAPKDTAAGAQAPGAQQPKRELPTRAEQDKKQEAEDLLESLRSALMAQESQPHRQLRLAEDAADERQAPPPQQWRARQQNTQPAAGAVPPAFDDATPFFAVPAAAPVQGGQPGADAEGAQQPAEEKPDFGTPFFARREVLRNAARIHKKMRKKRGRRAGRGFLVFSLFACGTAAAAMLFVAGLRLYTASVPISQPAPVVSMQPGQPVAPTQQSSQVEYGYSSTHVVELVAPSVVTIELYNHGELTSANGGSGVIYSADGYIITNAHVVAGAYAIRVVLADGRGFTATHVGSDDTNDIAVLKIQAEDLPAATFADSADLLLGQRVLAVGNAAGILPGSITQGVLSGTNRDINIETDGVTRRMILLQTDAAINPGNSGGALVDAWGRVIGINVAKLEDSSIDNIGFAIPTHIVLPVVNTIINKEYVPDKALLGVSVLALNETTGPPLGLPAQGLYVAELQEDSDLNRFGVMVGDVIVKAQGKDMLETSDLISMVEQMRPEDEMELEVWLFSSQDTIIIHPKLYLQ